MELLAAVDGLMVKEGCKPNLTSIKHGIAHWPVGKKWAGRKLSLFDDKSLQIAFDHIAY